MAESLRQTLCFRDIDISNYTWAEIIIWIANHTISHSRANESAASGLLKNRHGMPDFIGYQTGRDAVRNGRIQHFGVKIQFSHKLFRRYNQSLDDMWYILWLKNQFTLNQTPARRVKSLQPLSCLQYDKLSHVRANESAATSLHETSHDVHNSYSEGETGKDSVRIQYFGVEIQFPHQLSRGYNQSQENMWHFLASKIIH